ncbi:MAG TPA: amidohydrolase family protein [Pyrinomonadaceae bacterium]|jgi:imidazolonepropionase-like amidohydrolase
MIHRQFIILVVFFIGLSFPVFAQNQPTKNSTRQPLTAIRAAQLLDVKSGTLIRNAVVVIEGERISAVGAGLPIPAGATVMDLGDVTLLPGLIDCHTHLMADIKDNDYGAMLLTQSQAYRALVGASNARRTLLAGFTSARDVENEGSGYADVALRDAINRGLVVGPRMKVATRAVAAVGQYNPFGVSPDLPDFPRGAQMVSGVEEARRAVREQIGNGADLIKVYADWDYPTLTVEELKVIVEEAHKAGRPVAAHATTNEGIRNAVNAGVDSIEHGDKADHAALELMKQRGVWLVPTFAALIMQGETIKDPEVRKRFNAYVEKKRRMLQTARKLGVKIALGYDAARAEMHGTNAQELAAMKTAGFTNLELLRAATVNGAELLGWQDQVGSLEAGKFADIIAVRGDPLSDITLLEHVLFVMKGGTVVNDKHEVVR